MERRLEDFTFPQTPVRGEVNLVCEGHDNRDIRFFFLIFVSDFLVFIFDTSLTITPAWKTTILKPLLSSTLPQFGKILP